MDWRPFALRQATNPDSLRALELSQSTRFHQVELAFRSFAVATIREHIPAKYRSLEMPCAGYAKPGVPERGAGD